MKWISQSTLLIAGIFTGSIGGYLYYHYVGCVSGTCPITTHPINSTLYGAVLGGLLFSLFQREKISQE